MDLEDSAVSDTQDEATDLLNQHSCAMETSCHYQEFKSLGLS